MGGSPRGRGKPGPSYEQGELRDPAIRAAQDSTYSRSHLHRLIEKAVKGSGETPSRPVDSGDRRED